MLLDTLAATGGKPNASRVGKVISEPEPTTALMRARRHACCEDRRVPQPCPRVPRMTMIVKECLIGCSSRGGLSRSPAAPGCPSSTACAAHRPPCWATRSGTPKQRDRFRSVNTLCDRPGGQHRAPAQQHRVREARRDLLDVVGDQHHHRRARITDQPGDPAQQVLPAAQVQPGRGLVEQQQLRVRHQGPGDLDPLALAFGQGREPAPDQVRAAERVQQLDRAGHVGGVVILGGPAEDPVGRGQHQVDDLLRGRHPVGDGRAREADPGPQVGRVGVLQALAEDLGRARGRGQQRGRHLEQRGLAGAVRADDHPALVAVHGPVDVTQQHRLVLA